MLLAFALLAAAQPDAAAALRAYSLRAPMFYETEVRAFGALADHDGSAQVLGGAGVGVAVIRIVTPPATAMASSWTALRAGTGARLAVSSQAAASPAAARGPDRRRAVADGDRRRFAAGRSQGADPARASPAGDGAGAARSGDRRLRRAARPGARRDAFRSQRLGRVHRGMRARPRSASRAPAAQGRVRGAGPRRPPRNDTRGSEGGARRLPLPGAPLRKALRPRRARPWAALQGPGSGAEGRAQALDDDGAIRRARARVRDRAAARRRSGSGLLALAPGLDPRHRAREAGKQRRRDGAVVRDENSRQGRGSSQSLDSSVPRSPIAFASASQSSAAPSTVPARPSLSRRSARPAASPGSKFAAAPFNV